MHRRPSARPAAANDAQCFRLYHQSFSRLTVGEHTVETCAINCTEEVDGQLEGTPGGTSGELVS